MISRMRDIQMLGKAMNCIFDFQLSFSDVIAIAALLIAGLSALYARWSWAESKMLAGHGQNPKKQTL